jgi:hypothetical protein
MSDHPTHNACPRCGAAAGEPCVGRRPRADDAHSERRALGLDPDDDRAAATLDVQSSSAGADSQPA